MKFIFPQNYDFKVKFLGFLDYSTVIFNIIWFSIVLFLVNILKFTFYFKILLVIIFVFPLCIFSIVGFNGENIIQVFFYILKYLIKTKVYLYIKDYNS